MATELIVTEQAVTPPAVTTELVTTLEDATAAPLDEKQQVESKTFTQAELDEIIQARLAKAEAKAERQSLKRERELLERFTPQPTKQEPAAEPPRENYANDGEWVKAIAKWAIDQHESGARQQREIESQRATAGKTEKIYQAAAKLSGFDRDVFEELPLTPVIAQTIIDSDTAPQLMAYMSSHPDDVERISRLSPARQAAEIGRLEARLSVVTKAKEVPDPPRTVGGTGAVHNGDLSKMSMDDYIATRRKQGARY